MKILLIGEVYSENLGDPLLCQTVEHLILERYPDAEIVQFDMSGMMNTQYRFGEDGVRHGFRTKWDKLILYGKVYTNRTLYHVFSGDADRHVSVWCSLCEVMRNHKFDLAVFAGGALFMDYFAGAIYLIVDRLSRAGVKVVFHACGMGNLHEDQKSLLRSVFQRSNVTSISLRDGFERFCTLFPVGEKAKETYDTALNCSRFYPRSESITAEYGVGLIAQEGYFDKQVHLIQQFLRSDLDWKVFTNGASYDVVFAKQILQAAGLEEHQIGSRMTERPITASALTKTVTQFRNIVSFRMHSQIAAASYGVPCYGIAWDRKLADFYTKLGFPYNVNDEIKALSEIQSCLEGCAPTIQARALEQAAVSKKDLYMAIDSVLQ